VNPKVTTRVVWINKWFDPGKEREGAVALMDQGADVLMQNTDSTAVVQAANEKGKFAFGWDSDMSKFAPEAHLASAIINWAPYYKKAVREALDAYAEAGAWDGIRHRIEHIETLQDFDLPRFADEGVVASMQTQHMMWLDPSRTCNWTTRMGKDRCDRAFPTRSLWESGAVVALGSDWPVARFDPRIGMASAQLRHAPGNGKDPFDDQALTGLQALEGYTVNAAYTISEERRLGRIRVGFCADLTAFEVDPAICPPEDLVDNPVRLTMVDGEVIYRG
jgi:predicted amidohydrolase YtcJ